MTDDIQLDPNYADRFFAEKIISRDYKRLLLVMVDEENQTHVWRGHDGQFCDAFGLARIAIMQTEENWNESPGETLDPETGDQK